MRAAHCRSYNFPRLLSLPPPRRAPLPVASSPVSVSFFIISHHRRCLARLVRPAHFWIAAYIRVRGANCQRNAIVANFIRGIVMTWLQIIDKVLFSGGEWQREREREDGRFGTRDFPSLACTSGACRGKTYKRAPAPRRDPVRGQATKRRTVFHWIRVILGNKLATLPQLHDRHCAGPPTRRLVKTSPLLAVAIQEGCAARPRVLVSYEAPNLSPPSLAAASPKAREGSGWGVLFFK